MDKQPLLKIIVQMLALTEERELSCPEVFELMDYYAELEAAGDSVRTLLPHLARHLQLCPECAEEYKALQQVMTGDIASEA